MDWQSYFVRNLLYTPSAVWTAGDVHGAKRQLGESERWDSARLEMWQRERLMRLLDHASEHVPRYHRLRSVVRNLIDQGNATSHGADNVTSILQLYLPCTTKADIQGEPSAFRSTAQLGRLIRKTTGGSTGVPVTICKTRNAMRWELAATWRGYGWAGIGMGDRQARFWGLPYTDNAKRRARIVDLACNRLRCSAFSFRDEDMALYAKQLCRFHPVYFYGYVSMLVEFASWFRDQGKPSPYDLRCVITTSEVLAESQRYLLENVFRTRVFNEYGSGELGTVAHECECGGMHVSAENMIVEILDGNDPCEPGRMGELVITELNNYAMPLIRYRTGDYAMIAVKPCSCGRCMPVIEKLYGRAYDFVVSRDGRKHHGEFIMYIFEEAQRLGYGIRQFQVVQIDLGHYLIRVVPAAGFGSAAQELIARRIREHVDSDAEIVFELVNEIAREKSGKQRVIVGLPASG